MQLDSRQMRQDTQRGYSEGFPNRLTYGKAEPRTIARVMQEARCPVAGGAWLSSPSPTIEFTRFNANILTPHQNMQLKPPYMNDKYTLGHEGAGEIIEIGSKVPSGRFKVGDRIAVLSVAGCQEQSCGECSRGQYAHPDTRDLRLHWDTAEYGSPSLMPCRPRADLPGGRTLRHW